MVEDKKPRAVLKMGTVLWGVGLVMSRIIAIKTTSRIMGEPLPWKDNFKDFPSSHKIKNIGGLLHSPLIGYERRR